MDGVDVAGAAAAISRALDAAHGGTEPTRMSPRKLKRDPRTHPAILKLQMVLSKHTNI